MGGDAKEGKERKEGMRREAAAMLAVGNDKGRVRVWDTAPLLGLGTTASDSICSPPSTRASTPCRLRPKTVVNTLSDLERGVSDMVPTWSSLGGARTGACLALLPNCRKIAAACYADLEGAFLLWDTAQMPARTAAARNAGGRGEGGEQRMLPHTCVITSMAALHREFTNGQLSSYVVTGAADGVIRITQVPHHVDRSASGVSLSRTASGGGVKASSMLGDKDKVPKP